MHMYAYAVHIPKHFFLSVCLFVPSNLWNRWPDFDYFCELLVVVHFYYSCKGTQQQLILRDSASRKES